MLPTVDSILARRSSSIEGVPPVAVCGGGGYSLSRAFSQGALSGLDSPGTSIVGDDCTVKSRDSVSVVFGVISAPDSCRVGLRPRPLPLLGGKDGGRNGVRGSVTLGHSTCTATCTVEHCLYSGAPLCAPLRTPIYDSWHLGFRQTLIRGLHL